jgi:hypothetical protein
MVKMTSIWANPPLMPLGPWTLRSLGKKDIHETESSDPSPAFYPGQSPWGFSQLDLVSFTVERSPAILVFLFGSHHSRTFPVVGFHCVHC